MYESKINNAINNSKTIENKISFTKVKNNEYYGTFNVKNTNILLDKIINIELIQLLPDLNKDIFEESYFEKINGEEARVIFVLKHFFEDLGIPRFYMFLKLTRINLYCFELTTIFDKPNNVSDELKLLNISIIQNYELRGNHDCTFCYQVNLSDNTNITPIIEKMITQIFIKTFKRLKQFIENIKIT